MDLVNRSELCNDVMNGKKAPPKLFPMPEVGKFYWFLASPRITERASLRLCVQRIVAYKTVEYYMVNMRTGEVANTAKSLEEFHHLQVYEPVKPDEIMLVRGDQ